jgi:hypothetical protein
VVVVAAGSAWCFTFNQYTLYGIPGPGAGTTLADIKISMDLFVSGSETSTTPVTIVFMGNNGAADWNFTPTTTNDAYTHVEFTVNQATPPLLVTFDPTLAFNLRLQHGAGGFGFDANNIVRADNIVVEVVPEPGMIGVLGLGAVAALRRRRH